MLCLIDWTVKTRARAITLLHTILVYAEEGITGQLTGVLGVLVKIIRDEEPTVHTTAARAVQVIGRFVQPPAFLSIVLPTINGISVFDLHH
jgi:hypothetical protein